MEPSGIYTSSMSSGMLALEMSLQPQNMPQQPQQMQQQQHHQQHHMGVAYGHHEVDQHPQAQQSVRQGFQQYAAKAKNQSLTLSDDDEPGGLAAENSTDDAKRKTSPWHRMKWTDNMVRLLILVVYYIGDEVGSEGNDPSGKKKSSGVLQKKGKWKSVSRAMMERGFYVSPQQCEDKFNDLNKRYKRVNDILGKGTACRVVENQALLETMDHLSQKMKEEVKKLLNSKHLFFREMCAYHNSCNHGGAGNSAAGGGGAQNSPEVAVEPSQAQQLQAQQQRCLHSSEHAPLGPHLGRAETEGSKMLKGSTSSDEDDDGDEEDDEEDEDVVEGSARSHDHDDDNDDRSSRKKQRKGLLFSPSVQQLGCELMNLLQDGTKSPVEKREWMKARIVQLEEERLGYQTQAFELEKQRLKWQRFSSKKEREMERHRLSNEQMRLENERMVLLIRQKELELLDLQ